MEFEKTLSRELALVVEGLWGKGLFDLTYKRYGWQNPYRPITVFYVKDGLLEVWENRQAISWLLDKYLEVQNNNPQFLNKLFIEYQNLIQQLVKIETTADFANKSDQTHFIEILNEALHVCSIFYYTGSDVRCSETTKELCLQARKFTDLYAKSDRFIRKKLSTIYGISQDLAGVILPDEIGDIPPVEILENRFKNFVFIDDGEQYLGEFASFKSIHPELYFIQEELPLDIQTIKGQTAYKGIAQGKVCAINRIAEIDKIKNDDILVTPMTTPEYVPAMKKASAIITDEGGITCHAAIVARELKKPCIIGTKIATKVLHDGDLVEVDADKGIVRRISK